MMKSISQSVVACFVVIFSCTVFAEVNLTQTIGDADEKTPSDGFVEIKENPMSEIVKVYNKTELNENKSTGKTEIKYWNSFKRDDVSYGLKILTRDPSKVIVSMTKIHDDTNWYQFTKAHLNGSELVFLSGVGTNKNFELTENFKFRKEWADFSLNTDILIEKSCEEDGTEFAVTGKRRMIFTIPNRTLQGFLTKSKWLGADILVKHVLK